MADKEKQSEHPEFTVSPPVRHPLRIDFPEPVIFNSSNGKTDSVIKVVTKELAKEGLTIETAPPISVAFPLRIGRLNGGNYNDDVLRGAEILSGNLRSKTGKKWPLADDIFQVDHFKRAKGYVHSGFRQQYFASASAFKPWDKRKYFIVFEDALYTGHTALNLISYIEHHGGKVLAVAFIDHAMGPMSLHSTDGILKGNRNWIDEAFGKTIATAAEHGFNGGAPNLPTEDENSWCRWAIACKKLGIDIRDLTLPERYNWTDEHDPDRKGKDIDIAAMQAEHEAATGYMKGYRHSPYDGKEEWWKTRTILSDEDKNLLRAHAKTEFTQRHFRELKKEFQRKRWEKSNPLSR